MVDAAEIVVNAYARLKAPRAHAAFRPTNTNILLLPLLVRGAKMLVVLWRNAARAQ